MNNQLRISGQSFTVTFCSCQRFWFSTFFPFNIFFFDILSKLALLTFYIISSWHCLLFDVLSQRRFLSSTLCPCQLFFHLTFGPIWHVFFQRIVCWRILLSAYFTSTFCPWITSTNIPWKASWISGARPKVPLQIQFQDLFGTVPCLTPKTLNKKTVQHYVDDDI